MQGEGNNDLMTYVSALKQYVQRLTAASHPPTIIRRQRVLLRGLPYEVFAAFKRDAKRNPYSDYKTLVKALMVEALEPHVASQLRALKPGRQHTAMVTRSAAHRQQQPRPVESPRTQRMNELESILTTLVERQTFAPAADKSSRNCTATGKCSYGDRCRFEHVGGEKQRGNKPSRREDGKYCVFHCSSQHDTYECNKIREDPQLRAQLIALAQQSQQGEHDVNVTTTSNGYSQVFVTRAYFPQHILSAVHGQAPHIDRWCCDSASTTMATWDRAGCINIRPCRVVINGPNSSDNFVCNEMGDRELKVYNNETRAFETMLLTEVLISSHFPFHIFSEIVAFGKGSTCVKSFNNWRFSNAAGRPIFQCTQSLSESTQLYFINQQPTSKQFSLLTDIATTIETVDVNAATTAPAYVPAQPSLLFPHGDNYDIDSDSEPLTIFV